MFYMSNKVPFKGMKLFLSLAKGIDVEKFDEKSWKSLRQLHNQFVKKDLIGVILGEDSSSAILEHMMQNLHRDILGKDVGPRTLKKGFTSLSEKMHGRLLLVRMRVKIHVEYMGLELLEVRRVYIKNGKTKQVPEKKDCANTETRYRGESVIDCACRAAWQELRIKVQPRDFEEDLSEETIGKIHESSVYAGALSQHITKSVTLRLPEHRWAGGRIYKDGGVQIYQQWFQKNAA